MKMAGLCWLSVVLTFVLSAGDTVTAVDQNWLTSIVDGIKNQYPLRDAFTLAVSVPEKQDPNELQQVLQGDPADKVQQAVSQGQVYQGSRVVAAAQPEALARVLGSIDSLTQSSQGNFLIIYSSESPCGPTCTNTNQDGIADKINDVIQKWSGYAFVFSNVVDVPDASAPQMAQSFQQLAVAKMGLDNIFRCYNPADAFQCTSCSSAGAVTPSCIANTAPATQEQGAGPGQVDTGSNTEGQGAGEAPGPGQVDTGGNTQEQGAGEAPGPGQVDTGGNTQEQGAGEATGPGQVDTGGISGKPGRVRGCERRRGGCKRKGGGKIGRKCRRRGGCKRKGGRRRKGGKVRKGGKKRRGRKFKGRRGRRGRKGKGRGKSRGRGRRGRKGKGWGKSRGRGRRGRKGRRRGEDVLLVFS